MNEQIHISFGTRHRLISVLLLLALLFPAGILLSQTSAQSNKQKKEQLELQMKKLHKEIAEMEKRLAETSSQKKENLEQVEMLKEKIKKREALITNYSNQIGNLDNNIVETKKDIDVESVQVEKMKKDYAQMLRQTYSTLALQNQYTFLISSNSFNEAIARYNYLKRISDYRHQQAVDLDNSIHRLEGKKTNLEQSKKNKLSLLESQNEQKEKLENEKEETDKMISQLSEKEKKMKKYVDEKNKAVQALNSKIQKAIEDEIKQARKKAEDAAKKKAIAEGKPEPVKPKGRTEYILLSPKDQEMSKDFAGNKGKLPWPVAKGAIVGLFGKHEHSTLKGVFIENNGIDIKASDGVNGRAIFNGTVVSVFTLPTTQTCIIIKHGEYFSVYSNIAAATVKTNDNVITKQILGALSTDKSDAQTKIHLEIWKGKDKLNPAEWITAN
ncbi:MAG: rane-bound metallopeptidase [Bacteroidetes bacterium]|nr:rane-bound metallopeptidase [Bacteroidota bacterium]